jgi:predicted transcriptional regulator
MAPSRSLHVELDQRLYDRLAEAAVSHSLATSDAAAQAIEAWLDLDAWQRAEIEAGLAEADAGEFATEAEVTAVFDRWAGKNPG